MGENRFLIGRPRMLELNVGGKIFSTSPLTLEKYNNPFFTNIVKQLTRITTRVFIDRDPKHFDRILNYLRDGIMDMSGLDEYGKAKLERDLVYYCIDIPKKETQLKEQNSEL